MAFDVIPKGRDIVGSIGKDKEIKDYQKYLNHTHKVNNINNNIMKCTYTTQKKSVKPL